jgi:hypothetical protein
MAGQNWLFFPKSAIFHNQNIFFDKKVSGYSLTSRLVDLKSGWLFTCDSKKVAKGLPWFMEGPGF